MDIFAYPRLPMRLTDLVTPLKPLEAMAQGRLVVASDVGGHRELVRHGDTGMLFAAGDAEALAAAVNDLLARRDDWQACVSAAGPLSSRNAPGRPVWPVTGLCTEAWHERNGPAPGPGGAHPAPNGGMAMQTEQLARLLRAEGLKVHAGGHQRALSASVCRAVTGPPCPVSLAALPAGDVAPGGQGGRDPPDGQLRLVLAIVRGTGALAGCTAPCR